MGALALIAIILGSALVGFGGGWGVKGWKDTAAISRAETQKAAIESRNVILETENGECSTDIASVKQGVAVIVAAVEDREKAASAAMMAADTKIAQHSHKIKTIKALNPVSQAPGAQCAAIIQEQINYVQERKDGN